MSTEKESLWANSLRKYSRNTCKPNWVLFCSRLLFLSPPHALDLAQQVNDMAVQLLDLATTVEMKRKELTKLIEMKEKELAKAVEAKGKELEAQQQSLDKNRETLASLKLEIASASGAKGKAKQNQKRRGWWTAERRRDTGRNETQPNSLPNKNESLKRRSPCFRCLIPK
jgi:hypothetical protein